MQRIGGLWPPFTSKENFDTAWILTSLHRHKRQDIMDFEQDLVYNLEDLRQLVLNGKFHTSEYKKMPIFEYGKCRDVYILPLPDRIVHHALINIIEDIFVRSFISDTYGCIKGRGPLMGSYKCREEVHKYKYCLKTDIKKFYPTMNQSILFNLIKRKIKDTKLLDIIGDIVFSFEGNINVPIGNLTSQLFGNIYLSELDNYVKHNLRIKSYIRYCDDCVFMSNDKKYLRNIKYRIQDFIYNNLEQEFSYVEVFKTKQGVDFLGYRHFPTYTILRKSTAKRFKQALSNICKKPKIGMLNKNLSTIKSYQGWCEKCYSHNFTTKLNLQSILGDLTLKEFKEFGPTPILPLTGDKISILSLINKKIIINAFKITMKDDRELLKLQFYTEEDDKLKVTFTKSSVLIDQLQKVDKMYFPFSATIKQSGHAYYLE